MLLSRIAWQVSFAVLPIGAVPRLAGMPPVGQWEEHGPTNPDLVGSNLTGNFHLLSLASTLSGHRYIIPIVNLAQFNS